jgi:hypothetical protein
MHSAHLSSVQGKEKHMDQRPQGNFIASPLRYQTGNRPAYRGKVSIPGTDRSFSVALWSSKYHDKTTGEEKIVLNGNTSDVSLTDSAMDQVSAIASRGDVAAAVEHKGTSLRAGQIVLFTNGFKTEMGVDPDQLAKRPDFHGYWNPGKGEQIVQVSVWARQGRDGGAFSGATQYPMPKEELGKQEADDKSLQDLVESGDVTRGMPKGRRKGADRESAQAR